MSLTFKYFQPKFLDFGQDQISLTFMQYSLMSVLIVKMEIDRNLLINLKIDFRAFH